MWIIPEVLFTDDRLTTPLNQLAQKVHPKLETKPVASSSITLSDKGNVVLPCIAASRIGSDLQAAYQRAALGKFINMIS